MLGFNKSDCQLIFNFVKMNIKDRYTASMLGCVWSILNPVIMLSIFTFIFGFMYKSKLPGASTTLSYAIWMISGYGPWLAINEALILSSMSVVSDQGLIKNLAFKIEILPVAAVFSSIIPLLVSLCFLLILMLISGAIFSWTMLLIFPVIAVQYFFVCSLGLYLAAVTVFIRDVSIILPNILMIFLFLSPIFYSINVMPHIIREISVINPFYILSEGYRQLLINHQITESLLLSFAYLIMLSAVLYFFGLAFFRRVKGHFSSAL